MMVALAEEGDPDPSGAIDDLYYRVFTFPAATDGAISWTEAWSMTAYTRHRLAAAINRWHEENKPTE